jgi:aryl-alcohol dehydrogenase-like predicted oxidoreductase
MSTLRPIPSSGFTASRVYGNSSLRVSPLAFGAASTGDLAMSERDSERVLRGVLDLGITLIDTAPSYGISEERIGRHLASRRGDFVLSTKGGYGVEGTPDWTGDVITRGIERALRAMQTSHIDLFHLHSCPLATLMREDILRALERARSEGKIVAAAYSGENDELAWAVASGHFQGVQCSVNLFDQRSLHREVPEATRRGLGVLAKRPMGNAAWRHQARPTGAYAEAYWLRMKAMGLEPANGQFEETALRFSAFADGVTSVIVGSSSLEHIAANARALEAGPLADDEVERWASAFATHDDGWRGEV